VSVCLSICLCMLASYCKLPAHALAYELTHPHHRCKKLSSTCWDQRDEIPWPARCAVTSTAWLPPMGRRSWSSHRV